MLHIFMYHMRNFDKAKYQRMHFNKKFDGNIDGQHLKMLVNNNTCMAN